MLFLLFTGCIGNQQPPGGSTKTISGTNVAVTIKESAFNPPILTIPSGTKVTWENQDLIDHQVINDAIGQTSEGTLFKSPRLSTGGVYSFTFNQPGTYPYHCNIHPFMTGTITVT